MYFPVSGCCLPVEKTSKETLSEFDLDVDPGQKMHQALLLPLMACVSKVGAAAGLKMAAATGVKFAAASGIKLAAGRTAKGALRMAAGSVARGFFQRLLSRSRNKRP